MVGSNIREQKNDLPHLIDLGCSCLVLSGRFVRLTSTWPIGSPVAVEMGTINCVLAGHV